jgi:hypothetical protein
VFGYAQDRNIFWRNRLLDWPRPVWILDDSEEEYVSVRITSDRMGVKSEIDPEDYTDRSSRPFSFAQEKAVAFRFSPAAARLLAKTFGVLAATSSSERRRHACRHITNKSAPPRRGASN